MSRQQILKAPAPVAPAQRPKTRKNILYQVVPDTASGDKTFAVVIEGNAPDSYEAVEKLATVIQMSVREIGVSVTISPVVRTNRASHRSDVFRTDSKDPLDETVPVPIDQAIQAAVVDPTSLYDTKSGRLNAKRVSATFAVPLTTIAKVAGATLSAVSRTPDSLALQSTLKLFYRIAAALSILVGTLQNLRIWMNLPSQLLDGKTPWEVINDGEGEVVALVLESMVLGEPA